MSERFPQHLEGYHMRYSVNGYGRSALTTSHVVGDVTQKALCGRDASSWRETTWHQADCQRCRAKADAMLKARAAEGGTDK